MTTTSPMSTRAILHRAILADPDNLGARAAYVDYLLGSEVDTERAMGEMIAECVEKTGNWFWVVAGCGGDYVVSSTWKHKEFFNKSLVPQARELINRPCILKVVIRHGFIEELCLDPGKGSGISDNEIIDIFRKHPIKKLHGLLEEPYDIPLLKGLKYSWTRHDVKMIRSSKSFMINNIVFSALTGVRRCGMTVDKCYETAEAARADHHGALVRTIRKLAFSQGGER